MKRLVAFGVLLTASSAASAQTAPSVQVTPLGPNSALLSLSAEGNSERTPDVALFSAGVVTQGITASQALAENSRKMD